jgi:hypothetical protein
VTRVIGYAIVGLLVLLIPAPVAAYLGPGGVVSGIGALLALVAAVLASLFGFVWYPVKRLVRRLRGGQEREAVGAVPSSESKLE